MTCWKVLLLVSHAIVGNPGSSERVHAKKRQWILSAIPFL
ncbi:ribulose-phosphate 3-epimerase [Synechococcus sp. RS9916]|nr:ribulose-phosphate 3-epimerase [Synechococcus sp. RS9916]